MNICLNDYYNEYKYRYKSPSQLARVITERWVEDNMYCPFCSASNLKPYNNNYPVADFYYNQCKEEFQLKSKKNNIGKTIPDGDYYKMIEAVNSNKVPNFFFLAYSHNIDYIENLLIVPNQFIVPNVINRRTPLSATARRAGWTGCSIKLDYISNQGKIYAIRERKIISKSQVVNNVLSISFFREIKNLDTRGWINDVLLVISHINKEIFTLKDVYKYKDFFKKMHPNNNNIEAKIRQQLQILRDNNFIEFIGRGVYKKNEI